MRTDGESMGEVSVDVEDDVGTVVGANVDETVLATFLGGEEV